MIRSKVWLGAQAIRNYHGPPYVPLSAIEGKYNPDTVVMEKEEDMRYFPRIDMLTINENINAKYRTERRTESLKNFIRMKKLTATSERRYGRSQMQMLAVKNRTRQDMIGDMQERVRESEYQGDSNKAQV